MFAATYQDPQGRFSFEVPTGWRVQSLPDGQTVVSDGGASYASIIPVPGGGADQQLVKRVIDQVGAQWQRFMQESRGEATLSGQRGIFLMITGVNPKGIPATLRVVAAPFGEDAYLLLLSAPTAQFNKVKDAFKHIENTFALSSHASNPAVPPAVAQMGALPARNAPNGMHAADGPLGGRILYGALPDVSSGLTTFQAGLRRTRGYFDASPHLLNAVSSKDGRITMVVFSAALSGHPVNGLVLAAYDPDGNSHFALVFDDPNRLAKSLPSMMEQVGRLTEETVERARPTGGETGVDFSRFEAASYKVALKRTPFPDGTASIGVAPGFTPQQMGGGSFMASASDGAYIKLYTHASLLDPRGTLFRTMQQMAQSGGMRNLPLAPGQVVAPYESDPVKAWKTYLTEANRAQGAPDPAPQVQHTGPVQGVGSGWTGRLVSGTMTLHDTPFVFTGMLVSSPPPPREGGWLLQITMLGAPAEHAATDMPALIAMQHSIKVDMQAVRDQTMRNIEQMNQQSARWMAANKAAGDATRNRRFESSMANARASRDAMDRSTRGFINYISDSDVVQQNRTGAHATIDKNFASALEKADPKRFSVVPVNKYVKGVDY